MAWIKNIKSVFSKPKYLAITLIVALLFYEINVIIANWSTISSFLSNSGVMATLKILPTLSYGFKEIITKSSFITLVIVSILFGMLVSIISYKASYNVSTNKKLGILGTIGLFLGALAPGCAACGIGLATTLGLGTAFVTILPYKGLELSILAILILGFTIIKTSQNLTSCNINLKPNKSID
jgi:hypothetical protein